MPYATPAQYTSRFGLDEAAQLLGDEQALLTSTLLQDAINGTWTGTPSVAEQAAATAALARLTRQLLVCSNTMDGYLRAAVALPLAAGDANAGTLEDCCMALTRCALADDADNATERMDKAAETWRTWLTDVARNRVQLVGATGAAVPSSGGVRTGQAGSSYAWDSYGGVR